MKTQPAEPSNLGAAQRMSMPRLRHACWQVRQRFNLGVITRDQASRELMKLESDAYAANPQAESDGEITYTVSSTLDDIDAAQR